MFSAGKTFIKTGTRNAEEQKKVLFAAGLFIVLANLFAVYFMKQERFIYFWDHITYWSKYAYLSDYFLSDMKVALETVFWSIREDKYNHFPVLFLMPFGFIFGASRMAYILSIVNVFALPAVITFILLQKKLSIFQNKTSAYLPFIPVSLLLLSPDFWNPVLFGFVDIGGVVIMNLIYILYLKSPFEQQKTRYLVAIALLIPVLVIFRRWFAFWGVAFYAVLFMEICLAAVQSKPFEFKRFALNVSKYVMQVVLSAAVFFLAAPNYGKEILGTNYVDLNSAYRRSTNLFQSLEVVLKSYSLIYVSLFVLGSVVAIMNKQSRKLSIFILAQSAILFVMFARTQDFDTHHRYAFLPAVIIFGSMFLNYFIVYAKKFRAPILGVLGALLLLNFYVAFIQNDLVARKSHLSIITDIRHEPLKRADFKEIERILTVLKEVLANPDDRVYVLASSDVLNSNMLESAWMHFSQHKDICKKILSTQNIDKRRGFPNDLLTANYVLVADPVQYHMDPKNQRVVGIPAQMFLEQTGIANSFQPLPYQFNLDNGVKATLYKKVSPISKDDVLLMSEQLRQYYPDRPDIYKAKGEAWSL